MATMINCDHLNGLKHHIFTLTVLEVRSLNSVWAEIKVLAGLRPEVLSHLLDCLERAGDIAINGHVAWKK